MFQYIQSIIELSCSVSLIGNKIRGTLLMRVPLLSFFVSIKTATVSLCQQQFICLMEPRGTMADCRDFGVMIAEFAFLHNNILLL
ncbi:hypothetical protein PNBC_11390 [Paenibacillus crassostreae]|uniref:Uncharacterized protein n=1 Tax=Paenibacillus crassostreae TaxID=1763538 RepID=A0A167DPW4_9BACL|nr:hypothetical protein LPB68_02570 [Paenibacillus crassostreae]OAB74641.1 hypothetical protein PNBC_11390 [Paenibacillus crassostreae]